MSWDRLDGDVHELFAELSSPDFYDVSAQLELFVWHARKRKRENERRQYHFIKSIPSVHKARTARKLKQTRERRKLRRANDPTWAARMREYKREQMQRLRAAAKAA